MRASCNTLVTDMNRFEQDSVRRRIGRDIRRLTDAHDASERTGIC